MRGPNARKKQQALYGWVKWTLVIALPFGVIATDTWLNLHTWHTDYVIGELKRELRSLEAQMAAVQSDEAQLAALDRLTQKAVDLAMVDPSPVQLKTLQGTAPALLAAAPLPAPQPERAPAPAPTLIYAAAPPPVVEPGLGELLTVQAHGFVQREVTPRVDAALAHTGRAGEILGSAGEEVRAMLERTAAALPAPRNVIQELAPAILATASDLPPAPANTPLLEPRYAPEVDELPEPPRDPVHEPLYAAEPRQAPEALFPRVAEPAPAPVADAAQLVQELESNLGMLLESL